VENCDDCWVDRIEEYYANNQLESLYQHVYSGENCNLESSYFREGQLTNKSIHVRDGMPYYAQSTLINLLRIKNYSNTTSYTFIKDNEVQASSSYNSSFIYGDGGFPISETRTYLDGNVELYTYEYE